MANKAILKVLFACAILSPLTALAQYVSSGLIYPDGIEPGDPSVCEAPAGKTCYWVDCDAGADGVGTYASPFWGFETVFGYYDSGASYIQGSAVGGDIVYVKGTCEVTGSKDDATGPYKQVRIGRAAQMGTSSAPTIIKSYKGTAQAVFDGEYLKVLTPQVRAENSPETLIRVEQSATGNSYLKVQNIKFYRYHTNGIDVKYNTEGVTIQSVTCEEGRVDPTGTSGCFARQYNTAIVYADDFSYNYFLNNDNICDTYVGDTDTGSGCNLGTNDGTISLTTEASASNGSTVNIHHNRDVSSAKFIHEKHNGNVTVNVYQNYSSDTDTFIHLRAKQTNIYNNVITGTSTYVLEPDPENETLNVSFNFYNNSVYMTAGQLMYDIEIWNDDGTIAIYNNAIKSTSTTTPFMSLANFSGEYFVRASFTMDHNYFDVPSAVQTSFSCFGPTSAGAGCTTRNFADTKTELSDSTSSVTDPSFENASGGRLQLTPSSSARTAGRSGYYIGAIEHVVPSFCGDTVRGKAAVACSGISDADGDGYVDSNDCDDTNMFIYPGVWTGNGCSGGQIRKCNVGGSYGSCQALTCSDFSVSNTCKYIDCAIGSNSNAGTSAAPWKSLQMVGKDTGSTPAGWYDLAPGDTVFVAGTCADYYDSTAASSENVILKLSSAQSGTNGNPVTIMQWPGRAKAKLTAPFTYGGTHGVPIWLDNADYITLDGLEISDMYMSREFGTYGEGAGDGIFIENGASNFTGKNLYIHDLSCAKGYNCSGIETRSGSDSITIENSVLFDNYDSQALDSLTCSGLAGNTNFISFQTSNVTLKNSIFGYSDFAESQLTHRRGIPVKIGKHGLHSSVAGTQMLENNVVFNGCESLIESGTQNLDIHNNRILQSSNWGVYLKDLGGTTFIGADIDHNTIDKAKALFVEPTEGYNTDGSTAVDVCSGSGTMEALTFTSNIVVDNSASYSQDHSFILGYPYISDDSYTTLLGVLSLSNNCYYNSSGTALRFGIAEANNGCATACCVRGSLSSVYTSFATWTGAGFDSGTVNSNPTLDTNHVATTSCTSLGWNTNGGATPTPTPSPSPSPTPTPSATPTPPPGGGAGAGTAGTGTRFRQGLN